MFVGSDFHLPRHIEQARRYTVHFFRTDPVSTGSMTRFVLKRSPLMFVGGIGGTASFLQLPLPLDMLVAAVLTLRTLAALPLYLELARALSFPLNAVNPLDEVVAVETLAIEGAYDRRPDRGGGGTGSSEGGTGAEFLKVDGTGGTGVVETRLNCCFRSREGLLLLTLLSSSGVAEGADLFLQLMSVLEADAEIREPGDVSRWLLPLSP